MRKAFYEDGRANDQIKLGEKNLGNNLQLLALPPKYIVRIKCELWSFRKAKITPKIKSHAIIFCSTPSKETKTQIIAFH